MYFLSFLKWFWNDYLDDTLDRAGFSLIVWIAGILITVVLGIVFETLIFLSAYLIFSISFAILFVAGLGIMYMRRRYNEWQMQVVNRLKGQ